MHFKGAKVYNLSFLIIIYYFHVDYLFLIQRLYNEIQQLLSSKYLYLFRILYKTCA